MLKTIIWFAVKEAMSFGRSRQTLSLSLALALEFEDSNHGKDLPFCFLLHFQLICKP
jgi:hypothetical protein